MSEIVQGAIESDPRPAHQGVNFCARSKTERLLPLGSAEDAGAVALDSQGFQGVPGEVIPLPLPVALDSHPVRPPSAL
jgi:hypothetical protein